MVAKLIVIDSQSLFDWMVFRDPACAGWTAALSSLEWEWIFTSEMKAEFDAVAAKGFGERWPVDTAMLEATWARHAHARPSPAPSSPGQRLHCTDPDDQKFIDLALSCHAHTLVTRDRALLRLARKARERQGLRICPPAVWSAGLG